MYSLCISFLEKYSLCTLLKIQQQFLQFVMSTLKHVLDRWCGLTSTDAGAGWEKRRLETESASGISMKLPVIILNRAYE